MGLPVPYQLLLDSAPIRVPDGNADDLVLVPVALAAAMIALQRQPPSDLQQSPFGVVVPTETEQQTFGMVVPSALKNATTPRRKA